jgi:zinc-ribbon domain
VVCKRCGKSNADDAAYCAGCGAPLAAQAATAAGGVAPGAPTAAGPPAEKPVFHLDVKRWSGADMATGGATIVLFISLFLPWFGYGGQTVNGLWHSYEYLTLIVSLAILAYLVIRAAGQELRLRPPLRHDVLLLAATGVNLLIVLIGFLAKPSASSLFITFTANWEFGAFLGLLAAIVATAAAASPLVRERTAHP